MVSPKENCENQKVRKLRKKICQYVKEGRIRKLKKLYDRHVSENKSDIFIDQLNKQGKKGKTLLCKCCIKGDSSAVNMLFSFGAEIESTDCNGNNALHHALNYILENDAWDFFINVVSDMILSVKEDTLDVKNKYNETPNELIKEVFRKFHRHQSQYTAEDEFIIGGEVSEKSWTEKLFFELQGENHLYDESYAQDEFEDTYGHSYQESFDDWGDRIRREYQTKYYPKDNKKSNTTEENNKNDFEKTESSSSNDLIRQLKILKMRENYERRCHDVFSKTCKSRILTFTDIPWPILDKCISERSPDCVLDEVIDFLTSGFTHEEKVQYLKQQRIRWHPDRFQQKCRDRLAEEDKEEISDWVIKISQKLNSTLHSMMKIDTS